MVAWRADGVRHGGGVLVAVRGKAVPVDPIKPKLKPPGIKLLKLEYDGLLSKLGFKFNLRGYIVAIILYLRSKKLLQM